ncbi:hypothetical protein B0H12DRAFT_1229036 [Mycena haematopus]|nr:hypothetical protein B0H12DRAFT_1229036 [Mycena haematopus]
MTGVSSNLARTSIDNMFVAKCREASASRMHRIKDVLILGKIFSAEATSKPVKPVNLKRALYVIGGGDLGTHTTDLDLLPEGAFNVAPAWKTILLIEEARWIDSLSGITPSYIYSPGFI